jgi:hypothetical protein
MRKIFAIIAIIAAAHRTGVLLSLTRVKHR